MGGKRCTQSFGKKKKTEEKIEHLEDVCTDVGIILKWFLKT
jgi:hypothetical protein